MQRALTFGWRQVTLASGNKVLLNGNAITMRGDSWHFLGIPQMTRRYAQARYQAMRDANINAVLITCTPTVSGILSSTWPMKWASWCWMKRRCGQGERAQIK